MINSLQSLIELNGPRTVDKQWQHITKSRLQSYGTKFQKGSTLTFEDITISL